MNHHKIMDETNYTVRNPRSHSSVIDSKAYPSVFNKCFVFYFKELIEKV